MDRRFYKMLGDSFGRKISYLRLSVTNECGLCCRYCMPPGRRQGRVLLESDEIIRIVRILSGLGIKKVRLTGGEPLCRNDIIKLVEEAAGITGIEEMALTTNGLLLNEKISDLHRAGLKSVNIHLDTLNPLTYRWITGRESIECVLKGINAALDCGIKEVKINTVLMRGVNDREAATLVRFAAGLGVPIRFIELMPFGNMDFYKQRQVPASEVIANLCGEFGLVPLHDNGSKVKGPAVYYITADGRARLGFISSADKSSCAGCNRLRMLGDGALKNCISSELEFPLSRHLHLGDDTIARLVQEFVHNKSRSRNDFSQAGGAGYQICMNTIGG